MPMTVKGSGNDTHTEFTPAEQQARSDAQAGHAMAVQIPDEGGKIVRMPSGAEITAGGELLRQALKNGGVVLGAAFPGRTKVITINKTRAEEMIARGEAVAV